MDDEARGSDTPWMPAPRLSPGSGPSIRGRICPWRVGVGAGNPRAGMSLRRSADLSVLPRRRPRAARNLAGGGAPARRKAVISELCCSKSEK